MRRLTTRFTTRFIKTFTAEQKLTDVEISPAGLRDVEEVLALSQKCFSYNVPTYKEIRYFVEKAHAGVFCLRCVKTGKLLGLSVAEINAGNKSLYINMTCVSPDLREKGLGKLLYLFLDTLAEALGCHAIRRHTAVDNIAVIHIAIKSGYKIIKTIDNYFDNGKSAYYMRKDLPEQKREAV